MFKSLRQFLCTCLLILTGASLLTGCADIQKSMSQITDSITGREVSESKEKAEKTTGETPDREAGKQKKTVQKCPEIKIIDDLGEVRKFMDRNSPQEDERISTAKLKLVKHECRITDRGKGQVDLFMTFESKYAPASTPRKDQSQDIAYPYFIAVTNKKGEILSKDVFVLTIAPSPKTDVITAHESIRQIIPLEAPQNLADYHIAIGFQMSETQLRYNQKHGGDAATDEPESITQNKRNRPGWDAHKQIRNLRE